jgi:micrococcal nuclease
MKTEHRYPKSCKLESVLGMGLPVAFIVIFLLVPATAWPWTGKVIRVIDGDSLVASHSGRAVEIRLFGIDCPEWEQAFSRKAREYTARMLLGELVDVQPLDVDRYGRIVAVVSTDGKSVNEALVRAGLAWVHPKCLADFPLCNRWREIQEKVQAAGSGLWRSSHPIPPWEWKQKKRR